MSLSWPWALLALLAAPALAAIWWWARRRRRRAAVRVTSIALVRAALPGRTRWRRRAPVALLVLGLAVLGIGAARPQANVPVVSSRATIMIALDVSGSMCSTDVKPNRITAAEDAAANFVRSQAGGPRIGLVTFASNAVVVEPPTTSTNQLVTALHGLTTDDGTAIGDGILTSLDAIASVDHSVAPTGAQVSASPGAAYSPDVIVLLTDGSNNEGVAPQTAARVAAARRVRVFTIGYGTTRPSPLVCDPSQFGSTGNSGTGLPVFNGGPNNPLSADYPALRQIASTTGGRFFAAQNSDQLKSALGTLSGAFTVIHEHIDIADWFAGLGGLLIAAAVALSLWWTRPRQPRGAAPPVP